MLTEDQLLTLADEHSKSGAQRAAATAALRAAMQLVADIPARTGQAPDVTHGEAIPAAPVVICVGSTATVPKALEQQLWPKLDSALKLYGRIEIVTFGGRGNEVHAHKWAKSRDMPIREFAVAWTIVKPDGSTKRDGNALSVRDRKLKAYLAKAEHVYTLAYVDPDDRSKRRIEGMHAQILRWHPVKRVAPASPVGDDEAQAEAAIS